MSLQKAILLELFAIVWVLWVGFMPFEWHGALTFGVVLALAGVAYGFWTAEAPAISDVDTRQ